MKRHLMVFFVAGSALLCPFALSGCEEEISHTESRKVTDEGVVKEKEKTVTRDEEGKITTEQEKRTTAPDGSVIKEEVETKTETPGAN